MTIQDLGSIGELVAAVATVATLVYLAIQLRQNTRALRSATFQQISAQMSENVEVLVVNADLAEIFAKSRSDDAELTAGELLRLQGLYVMTMRRVEAVFVQSELGSIDRELVEGFETSLLPLLLSPEGSNWWGSAQRTFHRAFVEHVNDRLQSGQIAREMPSFKIDRNDECA